MYLYPSKSRKVTNGTLRMSNPTVFIQGLTYNSVGSVKENTGDCVVPKASDLMLPTPKPKGREQVLKSRKCCMKSVRQRKTNTVISHLCRILKIQINVYAKQKQIHR